MCWLLASSLFWVDRAHINKASLLAHVAVLVCFRFLSAINLKLSFECFHQPPVLAGFLYDAAHLYAIGVNRTVAAGGNPTDGKSVLANIFGRKFPSK